MIVWRRLAWVAGLVAIVLSLGAAFSAYRLADYSWNQVVEYESPFADPHRLWTRGIVASSEETAGARLALVIVDGLTLEDSYEMVGLQTVRGYGADMVATTAQPSLSYPGWTTILSGAPPQISGVTTNWFENEAPVETLLDLALAAGKRVVVVGLDDLETLFDAHRASGVHLRPWDESEYMSADFVSKALELVEKHDSELLILHLPDADEIAHLHGSDSDEYEDVVSRIDTDIARLVTELQDARTTFVIVSDHGQVAAGGHGGWEAEVTRVPAIFFGRGVTLDRGNISQVDIAPTVAALLGVEVPRHAAGRVRAEVLIDDGPLAFGQEQYRTFAKRYVQTLGEPESVLEGSRTYDEIEAVVNRVSKQRLAKDREARVPLGLGFAAAAALILVLVAILSWRGLVAALAGMVAYYALYNGLFFLLHGYLWSLSAFNNEDLIQSFFNWRMIEAGIAGLVAAGVAAIVYPMIRRDPRGATGTYRAGWIALGPATVLVVQATLALQVGWFLWAWGAEVTWRLPDLMWGFKYDLDLIQATALGAAAILSPMVTYIVGRYHPMVRRAERERFAEEVPPGAGAV